MPVTELQSPADLLVYQEWLKNSPQGSLWQSLEWKGYQGSLGRETRLYGFKNGSGLPAEARSAEVGALQATALVIIDRTTFGFCVWDIPRGPLFTLRRSAAACSRVGEGCPERAQRVEGHRPLRVSQARGLPSGLRALRASNGCPRVALTDAEAAEELLRHIIAEAKRNRCMALYFSPPSKGGQWSMVNGQWSARREQPEATLILDLTLSDEQLMAQMQPKGRYNIRVAQKHGVRVEEAGDVHSFYTLLRHTAVRDGFRSLPKSHYECFLHDLPGSFLLLAYPERGSGLVARGLGQKESLIPTFHPPIPIAGFLGVVWGKTGYYYYGASDYAYRALMAPYLLQWEAIKLCRARGCTEYDLLGIEHPGAAMNRGRATGSWAGLTRFKRQFGGNVRTYPPEQVAVLRPTVNTLVQWKRALLG